MFIYKGKRNYLHSSDVISFINKNYSFNKIDIKFHKILTSQPKIIITNMLNKKSYDASIVAKIEKKNIKKFLLFKETKVKIKNDYSYDENLLNKFFKLTNKNVKCDLNTEIKYIDLIVSMSKFWHVTKIKRKKWLVARVNLHKKIYDKQNKQISIRFNKIMNNSYTESEIMINKSIYGKIYFQGIGK